MKIFRSTTRAAGNMTILFLAAAALSVLALVWMGVRLVQQDRALEERRLEERREAAADRVVASLEQALAVEEKRLADAPSVEFPAPADDAVIVVADPAGIRIRPEKALLYYPEIPDGRERSSALYADAERAEFAEQDYDKAVLALRKIAAFDDPAVRAGAQLRLARNLRKAGRLEEALAVYDELAKSTDQPITAAGAPVGLAALRASCPLLEELGRTEESRRKAQMLRDGLLAGRWRLDRESYFYYSGQAAHWLGDKDATDPQRESLAEAVGWVWRSWHETRAADPDGNLTYGEPLPDAMPAALRPAAATGLPWNLSLANADLEAELDQFAQRRRLMTAGLGFLVVVLIATGCLMGRAICRELAAARLQSDFVAAVSHEFRTPLTSMRQFTEMLVENEGLTPEKRRSFYQAQERATRRLSRLVESLLDFGRMEAGARPYRLEPLDAGPLVQNVVDEFREEISPDGFSIECTVPAGGAIINADREALAQALWNLLDNAVKYSGDSRTVRVQLETGSRVSIRVRDRGFGIPPSEQERILRKFSRGSGAAEHGIKGTGIGLAMVKHIVDAHGGKILIDSEPGEGSTFTLRLPAGG